MFSGGVVDAKDDDEPTVLALRADVEIGFGGGIQYRVGLRAFIDDGFSSGEALLFDESAHEQEIVGSVSIGEETVVADARESRWDRSAAGGPESSKHA